MRSSHRSSYAWQSLTERLIVRVEVPLPPSPTDQNYGLELNRTDAIDDAI
jgi:hypothetical protein